MKYKLQIKEAGDTEWHTLNRDIDNGDGKAIKRLEKVRTSWIGTVYPTAAFQIVKDERF